jgi:putative alpha-1,2-mannosidase
MTGGNFSTKATSARAYSATGSDGGVADPNGSVTSNSQYTRIGGLFTFDEPTVLSRVGISWISIEKACRNLDDEIPEGTDFQSVVDETVDVWNDNVLAKITTTSNDSSSLGLLYTSLYFMNLLPTNKTGENPSFASTEPYYDDIFTLWDLFRCSTALLHIIAPPVYTDYLRSLIDIYRHDGYLPDGRSSNYNGRTQGGSNADNVLADAYVKGVSHPDLNWDDAYAAMVNDAEVVPPNTSPPDSMAPEASTKEGRGALPDWLEHGFLTTKFTRSASRAVEYAYNDFALYQVATGLEKNEDKNKYLNRSRNWRNHWNPDLKSLGFSGFVAPRSVHGFDVPSTPLKDRGYWGDNYYQGGAWDYSWADVHDIEKIIELMGGEEQAVKRLETMFTVGADPDHANGIIYDDTNEP